MRGTSKYLLLVLVGLMVGAIIPVGSVEVGPAADHGDASDAVVPFFVGEGGEGLDYTTHMTTAQEAISLADSCGVWEPGVDYNVQFDGFGTGARHLGRLRRIGGQCEVHRRRLAGARGTAA